MTAGSGKYGGRRVLEGTVVSDKTEKTVVVAVKSSVQHRLYRKIVRRVRRFMAHDDELNAHLGDTVRIVETRPMSRRKRWRVIEVLTRAELPEVAAESIDLDLLGEVKPEEEETAEEVAAPAEAASPATVAAAEAEATSEEAEAAEAAVEPKPEAEEAGAAAEEPPVVEEAGQEPEVKAKPEPEATTEEPSVEEEPPVVEEPEQEPEAKAEEAEEESKTEDTDTEEGAEKE